MEILTEEEIREKADNCNQKAKEDGSRKIEIEITKTLEERNFLRKSEVEDIIRWKMWGQGGKTGKNSGRAGKNIERLQQVTNETVELLTKAALQLKGEAEIDEEIIKTQVKILKSLPGVGSATATVILTFYEPKNYAVGDRYVFARVMGEEKYVRPGNYPNLLEKFKELNPSDLPLREVEKAYWFDEKYS